MAELNLTDLKTRRLRGDLIPMYKLVNNLESVNFVNGLNFSSSRLGSYNLRRHNKTIHREKVKNCLPRFNFFTNRIVNEWNKLPEEIVNAKQINGFKAKLDVWLAKNIETTAIAH